MMPCWCAMLRNADTTMSSMPSSRAAAFIACHCSAASGISFRRYSSARVAIVTRSVASSKRWSPRASIASCMPGGSVASIRTSGTSKSFLDPELVEHERVVLGNLVVTLEPARAAAVPGFHLGAEHEQVVVGAARAQARDVLRGLPVLDLRVPETGTDEHRRVVGRGELVVR